MTGMASSALAPHVRARLALAACNPGSVLWNEVMAYYLEDEADRFLRAQAKISLVHGPGELAKLALHEARACSRLLSPAPVLQNLCLGAAQGLCKEATGLECATGASSPAVQTLAEGQGVAANAATAGFGLTFHSGASPVLHNRSGGLAPQECASPGLHHLSGMLDFATNAAPAGSGLAPQACASPGLHNLSGGLHFAAHATLTGSGLARTATQTVEGLPELAMAADGCAGLERFPSELTLTAHAAPEAHRAAGLELTSGVAPSTFATTASQLSAGVGASKVLHPETLAESALVSSFRCNAVTASLRDATVL
jgi:hypothetical protein